MPRSQGGEIAVRIGYFFAGAVWGLLMFFLILYLLEPESVILVLAACVLVCGVLGALFGQSFFEWIQHQTFGD